MQALANLTEKNSVIKISNPIRSTVFFVLFFLYLWLRVDLRFIIHCGGIVQNTPVFYLGWDFLQEHLAYPGKPVEYVTAFMAQLWRIGWLGALITTIVAWLIFACTDTIIRLINAPYIRFVRFAGPMLLLAIYTRYTYHFDTAVSLLVALSFVVLYLKISQKQKQSDLIVFLVLSVVLYYLGGKSYSLFAVICWIYEWFFRRRGKIGLLYLLLAVAVPYTVEGLILGIGTHDSFINHLPLPLSSQARMLIFAYALYFMVPFMLLGLGLCRIIRAKLYPDITSFSIGSRPVIAISSEVIKTIILFVIAALFIHFSHDPRTSVIKADYYACRQKWPEVIRVTRSCPTNILNINMFNRASYHTGRLGYDMFTFPPSLKSLFLSLSRTARPTESTPGFWQNFWVYLDLGNMNYAQQSLWNALEKFGEQPVLLQNLAIVNMVKGNYRASRVHLHALSKTLFHADWADKYLEKLKSDPTLEKDEEIQQLRRVMLAKDYGSQISTPDRVLLNLLDTNKQNRMAFEYLMATYLLQRQPRLVYFIHNLHRLKDFNYPEIPRLYEEAILVYTIETIKPVDLHEYQISPESIRRYEEFVQSVQRHDNILQANPKPHGDIIATKLKAAREYIADNFGDSYMFYYYSDNQEQKNETRLDQDNVFAYIGLADDYRQLKQYDTAIKYALKALEIARDSIGAYYQLSLCYYEKGMFDEPEKHLNKELVEHPRYPKIAAVLAEKLYEKGQIRRAYKKYLNVLELAPDSLDGLNSVAWLQAASAIDGIRNPKRAVGYALKACKVTDNRNPEALDTLAVAYAATGDFQKAVETAQKAIEVANSQGNDDLTGRIQKRQSLYKQGKAYLDPGLESEKVL